MKAKKPSPATDQSPDRDLYRAMNEALVLGSVRQHALAVAVDTANKQLQHEIGERKLAEAKVRELNAKLEQRVIERTAELEAANHELQAFSYSISHDLRAPLRHIAGFVSLLKEDADPALLPKSQKYLARISASAVRMMHLIDDLLAFSRLGHSWMKTSDVNLNLLVREAQVQLQDDSRGRNIVWNIHALPVVQGDGALLRQVMVNLLANAVKFTGKRAEAKIEIGTADGGTEETVIFVRDNGAGFDAHYADKLFGVFQRLHTESDFPGMGIGLANVQRIISRHGGRVFAEGAVDAGATFYFSLPKQAAMTLGRKLLEESKNHEPHTP